MTRAAGTTVNTLPSPGRARRPLITPPSHAVVASSRDRGIIFVSVIAITALAWWYLFGVEREMTAMAEHDQMMADMGMTMDMSWGTRDVFFTFVMWAVMMVGMMAPSAAPVLLLFASTQRARGADFRWRWAAFGTGYFVLWTGFSAAAALLQWALHASAMLAPAMSVASAQVGGAILAAAGVYQLTPFKGACLTHCRTPLGFLMSHWREGASGALRMGIRHGAYCVGCCWALMCVLFAVGVMNLVWVAAITIIVLVEKTGSGGALVARFAGIAMIAAGAGRIALNL